MSLFEALTNGTVTTNGMDAYKSTLNKNLDLFFSIGTARGQDLSAQFSLALQEDADLAFRNLQWSRDVRGGAGERQRFRDLLLFCTKFPQYADLVTKVISKIPEIGRFDDLHIFVGTKFEDAALDVQVAAIKAGNGLAAKWAPRKGVIASKLRLKLDLTPKGYRKTIVGLTQVVEQKMCANDWEEINFSHVPSQAARIYANAFKKHDEARYTKFLEKVITGEEKMNAGAVFPHEIYLSNQKNALQSDAQWKSLPDYLEGTDEKIMVVADVSGSMSGTPMAVSVSLGLYFSERLTGAFKDCVCTFSANPKFFKLKADASLSQRIKQLEGMEWGMNTDLNKVFTEMLKIAVREKIPQEDMPTKLLIVSDMQFDACVGYTAMQMIEKQFTSAGYKMPQIVFWNVASSVSGNVPVTINQKGVALVSGSSPSVVKSVLGGEIDPLQVMIKTLMTDRYTL